MKRHDDFYQAVAVLLTYEMQKQKLSVSDVVKISGEQANTIKGILKGNRFNAHHIPWLQRVLKLNVDQFIQGATCDNEEESRAVGLDSFI